MNRSGQSVVHFTTLMGGTYSGCDRSVFVGFQMAFLQVFLGLRAQPALSFYRQASISKSRRFNSTPPAAE